MVDSDAELRRKVDAHLMPAIIAGLTRKTGQAAAPVDGPLAPVVSASKTPFSTIQNQEDAPPCSTCGAIMIRSGACYKCSNCGNTSGCA